MAMTGSDRTPFPVADTPFAERMGQFSPDGLWVAYETNQSGRPEIMVRAFLKSNGTFPVSTGGGTAPRWRADGKEVYFTAPDGTMMGVPVETRGASFEAGKPVALFSTDIVPQPFKAQYTVSRDGRFLVNNSQPEEASAPPLTVILNWRP
jgi:hypothetical protein